MLIFIRTFSGKITTVEVETWHKIKSIKQKVENSLNIAVEEQRLLFGSKQLSNNCQLSDYSIDEYSTLYLVARVKGGQQIYNFTFTSLKPENRLKRKLSYGMIGSQKIVEPGLNFQAECRNQSCKAYRQIVWVRKGFGVFNVAKEIYFCRCPICQGRTTPAFNIGYLKTYIKVEGKQDKEENGIAWEQKVVDDDFTTFVHGKQQMVMWNYLEITTVSLEDFNQMNDL